MLILLSMGNIMNTARMSDLYAQQELSHDFLTVISDKPERFQVSQEICHQVEWLYNAEYMNMHQRNAYVMQATKSFITALKNETDPKHKLIWMSQLNSIIYELHVHGGVTSDCYTECVAQTMTASMKEIENFPDDLKPEALSTADSYLIHSFPKNNSFFSSNIQVNKEACPAILKTYTDTATALCDPDPAEDSDNENTKRIKKAVIETLSMNNIIPHAPEDALITFGILSLDEKGEVLQKNLKNLSNFLINKDDKVKSRYINNINQKMNPWGIVSKAIHQVTHMGTREYFMLEDTRNAIAKTLPPAHQ
jgi:hypothetical protein